MLIKYNGLMRFLLPNQCGYELKLSRSYSERGGCKVKTEGLGDESEAANFKVRFLMLLVVKSHRWGVTLKRSRSSWVGSSG